MPEIRRADTQDFEIISALAHETWNDAYKAILSQEQITYMLDLFYSQNAFTEQTSIKNHHFLLIHENGKYLGFASYELNYLSGTARIHKLYVLPETQGMGAGRLLVAKMEEIAKNNGNDRMVLNVNRYNKAVDFYRKNGYEKTGEEDIDIGSGYLMEDYIMAKNL